MSLVLVSDLDGTLLDRTTYAFDEAREALDALKSGGVPLVLATSKTLAEVRPIAAAIGGHLILIVENGGAVVMSSVWTSASAHGPQEAPNTVTIELGTARGLLVQQLAAIAEETGTSLVGFNELPVTEIARLTGLSADGARLAAERHYDEPFLIDRDDRLPSVAEAARRRGLVVTTGDRFHHLTGQTDKGAALAVVLGHLARKDSRLTTIGLGDASNDLPFLRLVDRPVLVPLADGSLAPDLAAALPRAERAPYPGPRGWNAAVLAVLSGQSLVPATGSAT
jgi:mannosyl-3-phosphoglycerate phosphatase family protein